MQHEFKTVQALRGRESSAKAKWQEQGWELVSENRGALRTELNFRRLKEKAFGASLLGFVATFRRLRPKTKLILVASCALILVAGIVGIVVGTHSGGDTADPSAAHPTASTARSSEAAAPHATASSQPEGEQVLTAGNSSELAALLKAKDYCSEAVAAFATKYVGRTIEFNGSIAAMANHGDYDTRYDILVASGNKGPESAVGPGLKFEDVNVFDLNLTGAKKPDSVSEGDRFRFVAQVLEYNPTQCLLFLAPVSTGVR